MIKVVKLNKEQWEKILPHVIISDYGDKFTYFESIEKILTADKVVTLNGHSMWKKSSTTSSIAERIERYHMIFELPNGNFAVSSQKFNDYYIIKKEIIIIDEEQITWYSHSSNSFDITL
ncbi:MAG: hypothetical protein K8S23_17460 [Candidatus Cloacimonetes bacterium]|nr:hypothetical protein [Candidatus Cloacimonadota bacterium]